MQVDFECPKCGAPLRRTYIQDFEKRAVEIYQQCAYCGFKSMAIYPKPSEEEAISQ